MCRVWDMRTKVQVHCLAGHDDTVASILANPTSPEVSLLTQACNQANQRAGTFGPFACGPSPPAPDQAVYFGACDKPDPCKPGNAPRSPTRS